MGEQEAQSDVFRFVEMKLAEELMNFLYPPHCPKCNAYVETRGAWCETCLRQTACVQKLPLSVEMAGVLASVWTIGHYRGGLRELIRGLKYQGKKENLPYIHTLLRASDLNIGEMFGAAAAVPVPLHSSKERERGFNQTELIFRDWLENSGIPMERMLSRNRRTAAQYGLAPKARRQNLRGAFSLVEGADVRGRRILLLDDIMTTGATLFECAKVLKEAGAAGIHALVLASDRT